MIFCSLLKSEIRDANKTKVNKVEYVTEDKCYNGAVSLMAKLGILKGRTNIGF